AHFAALHAARPEDASVSSALERLFERADRKRDLVALLASREAEGAAALELGRRVASLWLELEDVGQASRAIERLLDRSTRAADLADLALRIADTRESEAAFRVLARLARIDD